MRCVPKYIYFYKRTQLKKQVKKKKRFQKAYFSKDKKVLEIDLGIIHDIRKSSRALFKLLDSLSQLLC